MLTTPPRHERCAIGALAQDQEPCRAAIINVLRKRIDELENLVCDEREPRRRQDVRAILRACVWRDNAPLSLDARSARRNSKRCLHFRQLLDC
jgi:hypothetical protein